MHTSQSHPGTHTHTHAWPHSTQSSASPAVCGLTCVPTGRAALFLPHTHRAPPACSAPSTKVPFCPLDPGSQGPLEPWAQPCPHSAGRPLAFSGTIRKQQGLQKSMPLHLHALHTHAVRAGDRSNSTPGLVLLGAQPGRGRSESPPPWAALACPPAAISAHRGPEQQTADSDRHPEHCVVLFSCS